MSNSGEQNICIKFCLKFGKTSSERHYMLQTAFGQDALSKAKICSGISRFKDGQTYCL
jgi:hypothetical protein